MKQIYSYCFAGLSVLCFFLNSGCQPEQKNLYKSEIDSVGIFWVPDLSEGIFDVELVQEGSEFVLKGETNVGEAKSGILSILNKDKVNFKDSLKILPDTEKIREPWGLVNVSVCNIRLFPAFDAEMVTQAQMGTPVKIFKDENGWMLIQTPDMYIGWVDIEALETLNESEISRWKSSDRLFYTGKIGDVFADPSMKSVISDIVAGCIVEMKDRQNGLYEVLLPDGRKGFIPEGKAFPLNKLTVEDFLKPENLIATAESFMGIPYLWGGTSTKGFDCSGFIKTIYYLNGLILPRDASQQFQKGIRIRRASFPDSLKQGDLLFFGSMQRGRPKPTHVGMYIGNSEFIHASGMVRINSLDSTRTNFSRFRKDSFIGIRRIKGAAFGPGIQPVLMHDWYK